MIVGFFVITGVRGCKISRSQKRGAFFDLMGLGDTGTAPDLANAGTTNVHNFGKAVATRYAGYPNIVWHVMGDFGWSYNQGPGLIARRMIASRNGWPAVHQGIIPNVPIHPVLAA